jgi:hypothetical protein
VTHYIGNLQLYHDGQRDTITIMVKNPQAWDNEPKTTEVSFPASDIENLIKALRTVKSDRADYAAWGGPGNW